MKKLIEYPSISHFKEVKTQIHKLSKNLGKQLVLRFEGYVKLHGSNLSLVYNKDKENVYFQSRNNVLHKDSDFYGFNKIFYNANDISLITEKLRLQLRNISKNISNVYPHDKLVVFGEFVGQEIQRKVALEQLPKQFVLFDIATSYNDELKFLPISMLKHISSSDREVKLINNYKIPEEITINIWNKEDLLKTQNTLHRLTEEVEKECPFAKNQGVSGIGEGIIWRNDTYDLKFKVKGDSHSNSKVRTLKQISEEEIKKATELDNFCEMLCTENRYNQGLQFLKENVIEEPLRRQTFLKWVVDDIFKEEIEYINESGFDKKVIKTKLYQNANKYWSFKY